jgi:hypothetical protein
MGKNYVFAKVWQSLASQGINFSLCKRSLHNIFVSPQCGEMVVSLLLTSVI